MTPADFSDSKFIRTGGSVGFEERGAQPSDFTEELGYPYAKQFAETQGTSLFSVYYPNWQPFADCFIMRRSILQINGQQKCVTETFRANDLEKYKKPGFQNVKNFRIPGADRSSIPGGKYQLTNLSFADEGNGMTNITISYQQYGEWELIQLIGSPPSPGKGPGQ